MNQYYREGWTALRRDRITWGVQRLILLSACVFAAQLALNVLTGDEAFPAPGGVVAQWFSFEASAFFFGRIWTPVTYLFIHTGLMHLSFNMLWLFFFGPDVERALGTRQFLYFYVICGAAAVLPTAFPLIIGGHYGYVSGASGAVMAVLVAFAVIDPERELILFPLPVPINARALVIILLVLNLFSAWNGGGAVSIVTHLGGMASGYVYMTVVPRLRLRKRARNRPNDLAEDDREKLKEAIDNIFKFDDKRRKH